MSLVGNSKQVWALLFVAALGVVLSSPADAGVLGVGGGVGGSEFKGFYDWLFGAATGYLARSICIVGGLIGLGYAAASTKALPAVIGVFLAIFGLFSPAIINSLFTSAVI